MALNTNKTTTASLAPTMQTYYDRKMLEFAKPYLVHSQFAVPKNVPKNSGKVVQWRRYVPLPVITEPLLEAEIPDGQQFTIEEVLAQVYQYGGYAATSDLFKLAALDSKLSEEVEVMADQGGRSVDAVVRDEMATTLTTQYVGGRTGIDQLRVTDVLTIDEIRKMARTLKNNKTPFFTKGGNPHFVAIVDPDTEFDIQNDEKWIDVATYQDKQKIYNGELGKAYGVRFVLTTESKKYVNDDLIAGSVSLTAASLSSATVTVDEAITAAEATALAGREVNIRDTSATPNVYEKQTIVSAVAGAAGAATVTLDAAPAGFTLADGDILYANEYGFTGNTVHGTLVFGDKAYAKADINGSGRMRIIVKPKDSGGPSNPLEQFGTVGWKVEALAVKILQDLWIGQIFSGASE